MFTFFFFNDTATTEIYTLSLHDALPIYATENTEDTERNRGRSWFGRGRRFFFGERANVINHVPFHFGFCAVLVARHLALTLGQDVKELAVSQVFERRRIAPVAQLEL